MGQERILRWFSTQEQRPFPLLRNVVALGEGKHNYFPPYSFGV